MGLNDRRSLVAVCRAASRRSVRVTTHDGVVIGLLTSWTSRSVWLVDNADHDVVLPFEKVLAVQVA